MTSGQAPIGRPRNRHPGEIAINQRSVVDAVVFILMGTFVATYALLLVSWRNPGRRLLWFAGRDPAAREDPTVMVLNLVGVLAAVWGGTGLQQHVGTWLAGLVAVGPLLGLRAVVLILHNRRVRDFSEVAADEADRG